MFHSIRCELCGKVMVRRRDLERHIQSKHSATDSSNNVRRQHQPNSADSIDCPSPLSSSHSSSSGSNNNSDREDSDIEDQLDVVDIC